MEAKKRRRSIKIYCLTTQDSGMLVGMCLAFYNADLLYLTVQKKIEIYIHLDTLKLGIVCCCLIRNSRLEAKYHSFGVIKVIT